MLTHPRRLIVLKGAIRNKILSEKIPCPPLDTRGSVSTALDHVQTRSLSRGADRGLIGSVMPLPPFALHHQSRKVARGIAEINSVPVKGSFPTSVNFGIRVVALSRQYRKTDKRNVRRQKTGSGVEDFGAIRPTSV